MMRCNRRKSARKGLYPTGTKCKLKCRRGYRPTGRMRKKCGADGLWSGPDAECQRDDGGGGGRRRPAKTTCSPVPAVPNGRVEPSSCRERSSPTGTVCQFACNPGYSLTSSSSASSDSSFARCGRDGRWEGLRSMPACSRPRYPEPFILCPPDITKPIHGRATSAYVMFPQPKTNVDWFRLGCWPKITILHDQIF